MKIINYSKNNIDSHRFGVNYIHYFTNKSKVRLNV